VKFYSEPNQYQANFVSFNIAIRTIQELDSQNNIVTEFDVTKLTANLTKEDVTTNNVTAEQLTYLISIPNRAVMSVVLLVFANATSYPFAGKSVSVPDNSVKYSITIENWAFANIRNRLQLVMKTDGATSKGNDCQNTVSSKDGNENLQWFKLNVDGVSLYAQFVEDTLVDGRPGKVGFELDANNDVKLTVPSFWEAIQIDPVYTVLLDPKTKSDCSSNLHNSKNNVKGSIIGGTVGGIVGTAALIGASIYGFKVYSQSKLMRSLTFRQSVSMKSLNDGGFNQE